MNASSQNCVAMKRVIVWVSCLAVGALLVAIVWSVRSTAGEYSPRSYTNDPAFAVISYAFTHGTNHTMNTGYAMLAKINAARISARKRPFTHHRHWSMATTQNTSVLWVSFKHPPGPASRVPPYLTALLSSPNHGDEVIRVSKGAYDRRGYMFAFTLPSRATNYSGWQFHLVTVPEGTRVISFDL